MDKKTILVTGGAGFIGSNFVLYVLNEHKGFKIVNLDLLTYAGNLENLISIEKHPDYTFVKGDICNKEFVKSIFKKYNISGVINFAAESHVDRSIYGAEAFIETNIKGTFYLLEVAKEFSVEKFLQISTDEVYGSLGAEGYFTEETPLAPNSPYSASKTSADLIVRAYNHTYGFPTLTTRCSNNYGPYQFPEKLIPLMIINALTGKKLPVYGDGKNIRDWLHVKDHCTAIMKVYEKGKIGEIYNIGGNNEWKNIDIVKLILKKLGKPDTLIEYVKDRPGHDLRYAIDSTRIQNELGWKPSYTFDIGIEETVNWYLNNKIWWEKIISGEYQKYYDSMYVNR